MEEEEINKESYREKVEAFDSECTSWFDYRLKRKLAKEPFRYHEEGSPYLGLSIKEQRILASIRRGGVKTPVHISRSQRKAVKQDYINLVYACVESLINRGWDETARNDRLKVEVRLPFNWGKYYDKTIPRAETMACDDYTVVVSWGVDKLLNWLHEKGHSPFKASEFRKALHNFYTREDQLDQYYQYATNESIVNLYSDIIADTPPSIRTIRGRQHYRSVWYTPVGQKEENASVEAIPVDNKQKV